MQAVEQPSGSIAVFTRWGRTGTAGSSATEKFDDVELAIQAFGKKFEQKTGVAWEDIGTYTPQPKKYLWCGLESILRTAVSCNPVVHACGALWTSHGST